MTITASTIHTDSLLRVGDLGRADLEHLLSLAERMKLNPPGWRDAHAGKAIACYFAKPSTRTRVSFEAAAQRLGILPIMLRPDELQIGRGEPISDTARVLSGYVAAIVIRTFAQTDVEQMAIAADVPVINALTDDHHPCQALADLLTLRERFGALQGLKLAYVGDGNNVANSLMEAGALVGMDITVATPAGYEPSHDVFQYAKVLAVGSGAHIDVVTDVEGAVEGANAVYTDVWVSMGDEAEAAARRERLRGYQVTPRLMRLADANAVFMHCLPAHRDEEVAPAVIDGPQSVVMQQAHNRLPTEQALLHSLIGSDWDQV
jgi:ornithine carbamoyltransferase